MTSATGEQYVLTHESPLGVFTATITQVAASLREFRLGEIELVEPYSPDATAPLCAGQIMTPWVNRLDKGEWKYRQKVLHNPINLAEQQNANHGLMLDHLYDLVSLSDSAVSLHGKIAAREGYPFEVDTTVTYELTDAGLVVTHTAVNRSADAAPYAVGAHPYFKFSSVYAGDLVLKSGAATLTVVNPRQIPVAESSTVGSEFDLREGVRVRDKFIDEDFTNLPRDEHGNAHTYLLTDDGRGLDVWQDTAFKHVVIFTPDYFPARDGSRVHAAAIEPSTAAPNAFNSGRDLLWLENGEEFVARWGVNVVL